MPGAVTRPRKLARGECRECPRKVRAGRLCWECRQAERRRKRREYWAKFENAVCVGSGCLRRAENGVRCDVCRETHNAARRGKRSAARPPMEVRMSVTEARFQAQVIQYAQLRGWRVAHFRKVCVRRPNGSVYYETPVAADGKGFPDLELVRGDRLVKVELKVGKNKLEPEQESWRDAYRRAGVEWHVWRPEDWPAIEEALS